MELTFEIGAPLDEIELRVIRYPELDGVPDWPQGDG
jgi:hypothetical protein